MSYEHKPNNWETEQGVDYTMNQVRVGTSDKGIFPPNFWGDPSFIAVGKDGKGACGGFSKSSGTNQTHDMGTIALIGYWMLTN